MPLWVTAYYAGFAWNWTGSNVSTAIAAIDFTTMTHLTFARYAPGAGSLGGNPGDLLPSADTSHEALEPALIPAAQAAGVKVIMMVGGEGEGPGWDASTADPGTRATFITNLLTKASALAYDGIDIDWEENLDTAAQQAQAVALLTELRQAAAVHPFYQAPHAPLLLTWPGPWGNINYATVTPWHVQIASLVDQYNVMTYAMAGNYQGWESWHFAALANPTPGTPTSVSTTIAEYLKAGVPPAKLGIGIGLYALTYPQPVTGPGQSLTAADGTTVNINADDQTNNHHQLYAERAFNVSHAVRTWDASASQSYFTYNPPWTRRSGEVVSYMSYESARSIEAKGAYAKEQSLGGAIVWTYNYGYLPDPGDDASSPPSNPMMQAVKKAFLS